MPAKRASDPSSDVFINCPFDEAYSPVFRALVFTISACGYRPRCALEESDSGDMRFARLKAMIAACDFAIHDLSRTELSKPTGTPRFNMPFELGLFLGAKHFGGARQRRKRMLVLAESREKWAPSISDLAGCDPVFHAHDASLAIAAVRDFLHRTPSGSRLPGEEALAKDLAQFSADLPRLAASARQTVKEAQKYANYATFVAEYLRTKPASV